MASMLALLAYRWIYRQVEGSELVLLGVAGTPEELVCWSWKRSGLIAYLSFLG